VKVEKGAGGLKATELTDKEYDGLVRQLGDNDIDYEYDPDTDTLSVSFDDMYANLDPATGRRRQGVQHE
jgi:hypothetical protein